MLLVITGGGTGGHVYPALEVARLSAERGATLLYLGSNRGQERNACALRGIAFRGFPSEPLWSLRSVAGWRSLLALQRSRGLARRDLKRSRPDVVFSTGGYSAGPVIAAARDLRIPYIVHSADSIPPRSSAMFAKQAVAFTTVFRATSKFFTARPVVRTGQPIRQEMRPAAALESYGQSPAHTILVLGGSQGSEFLNEIMPKVAAQPEFMAKVIHATGPKNHDRTRQRLIDANIDRDYELVPYLETSALIEAYRQATVVVARSGGTLAEIAMFGLPSVLIPLPSSANDHQLENAREFESMEAATVLWQPNDRRSPAPSATPEQISESIGTWLGSESLRAKARHNLKEWDVPDATDQIVHLIESAASKPQT